jgi:hypothetical protein
MQMHERASKAEDVVRVLRMLGRTIPGTRLIVWDGSPIHCTAAVKPCLASLMGTRVYLERVPGDAPDLTPPDVVWNVLTRRERQNLCGQDRAPLHHELVRAKDRLRHRQETLPHGCIHALAEVSLFLTRSVNSRRIGSIDNLSPAELNPCRQRCLWWHQQSDLELPPVHRLSLPF